MAYPTSTEVAAYLLDEGYAQSEVSDAKAQRLLDAAIGEWDAMTGCVPFLAAQALRSFDPRDIQADRRGYILDLPQRIAGDPSLIKSNVTGSFAGTTFVLNTDYELPDSQAPYTQLVFLTRPLYRLQITADWGHTTDPGSDVADAIYSLCAARFTQEGQGVYGILESEKTGLVETKWGTAQGRDVYERLHSRAREVARKYWR